jgi:hypothetical protein
MNSRTITANPAINFNLSGIILRVQVGANILKAMVKSHMQTQYYESLVKGQN